MADAEAGCEYMVANDTPESAGWACFGDSCVAGGASLLPRSQVANTKIDGRHFRSRAFSGDEI